MSLRNRLMLASCSVSLWGNERKDSSVVADVAASKQVKKGKAGKWKTNLLAGADAEYEALKSSLNICRSYHYKTTLSWGKRGEQVLPTAMFIEYSREMLGFRAMADQRLEDLCAVWAERIKEAQLNSPMLTAAFVYPTESDLRKLCGVTIEINPLPESGDLILGIEGEEAQKLLKTEQLRIETATQARVNEAMKDLWTRFDKILKNAHRNLQLDEGQGRFRTEWHENLTEYVALADKLNFNEDPELTRLVAMAEDTLLCTESADYKDDQSCREEGEQQVNNILEQMKDVFA